MEDVAFAGQGWSCGKAWGLYLCLWEPLLL